ncbi:MAG: PH domain-containing protein, partial [Thermoguttaceae bacterium]|nr:PH domain-containing protein [Thermoguttaceae bacterium]
PEAPAEAAPEPAATEPATEDAPAPVASDPPATPTKSESKWYKPRTWSKGSRILAIWILCLVLPIVLTVWRSIKWLFTVYGKFYELRTDPDNPRATTFLMTSGIFNKKTDTMLIGDIVDIRSSQSFWQKYFKGGVGTITLFTKDKSNPELPLTNMNEPSRVFNALDELRRQFWSKGGMQLGAAGAADDIADADDLVHDA